MTKALILSYQGDQNSESVRKYFEEEGIDYFEVNTDKLIGNYNISFDLSKGAFTISSSQREIVLNEDWAIWNRRVRPPKIPSSVPNQLEHIILTETERTWQGLLGTHPGRVVNRPHAQFKANDKIDQLLFAHRYGRGIRVPKTVLTNDLNVFREFYASVSMTAFKLLQAPVVETGREKEHLMCYTNLVSAEAARRAELIRNNPSLFQEYIEKEYELRITVLEKKVIPIKIDSQNSAVSAIDFRRYDFENVSYGLVEIPLDVELFCLDLIHHYGLFFGEIDMIKAKNGDYVFLEINPNGQWLWLESQSGYPLTKEIAENILGER